MKNLKYILSVSLGALFLMTACDTDEFLEEDPQTFYTVDNIFKTSGSVNQVLNTCYTKYRDMFIAWNCSYQGYSPQILFQAGAGTDMFDLPFTNRNGGYNYSAMNATTNKFTEIWKQWYVLISTCNTAIYGASLESISWSNEADKANAIAQARCLRAIAYRNLGELYGGVPLVTEMTTEPRYDYELASHEETLKFAISEFESILNDLPLRAPAGRVNRSVVQHNLCQLYLDLGIMYDIKGGGNSNEMYNKALSYANDIIESGNYRLMTERFGSRSNENPDFYFAQSMALKTEDRLYSKNGYGIEGNVYWDLFQKDNQDYEDGNTESIWCTQSDWSAYWEVDENFRVCLDYPCTYGPMISDYASAHIQGDRQDTGGYTDCRVVPTEYTRDLIWADKWGDDMRNSEAVYHRIYLGNQTTSEYFGKQIPWKVLYDVDNPTMETETYGGVNQTRYGEIFPMSCKTNPDWFIQEYLGWQLRRMFRDDYYIRLPETILLRAEIEFRTGNSSAAAADINKLRERAKCGYLVQASDVSLDLILDERARELMYEPGNQRWNTLLRMGKSVMQQRIKKYALWDFPRTYMPDFEFWPIPQSFIDSNTDNLIPQNEGWK